MTTVHGYVLTVVLIHVSFVIGAISYALRDVDQNRLAGLRTPATLQDPELWQQANRQVAAVMPFASGVCLAVASLGFWIPTLRTGLAFLIITGFQLAVLVALTIDWWSPRNSSISVLREKNSSSNTPESQ
jgi:uncharacterized membrane protein